MFNRKFTREGVSVFPGSKVALCAFMVLLAVGSAWSAPTDYAMKMPLASKSLLLDVANAGDRVVAVGERGHILYSDDLGATWVQARVPTSVMLTRVFFATDKTGWAVGHDGNILVSRDGGVNWELQRDGLTDQVYINEARVSRAKQELASLRDSIHSAGSDENAELLEQLEDAEYALEVAREVMAEPVYAPPLMDAWFCTENRGWASGAFGSLLHTTNGGSTWEDYSYKVGNEEELHLNGVAATSVGAIFLTSEWGIVFRSQCEGESWEMVETGYDGTFFGVVVNPVTDSVFAYGLLGTVYRSTDQGRTWEEMESKAGASLFGAVATAEGALVFVGLRGTAVATLDDGDSFFPLEESSGRDLYGVAQLGQGQFLAIGAGGSVRLAIAPGEEE